MTVIQSPYYDAVGLDKEHTLTGRAPLEETLRHQEVSLLGRLYEPLLGAQLRSTKQCKHYQKIQNCITKPVCLAALVKSTYKVNLQQMKTSPHKDMNFWRVRRFSNRFISAFTLQSTLNFPTLKLSN